MESLVDDLGIEEPQRTRVVAGAQAAGVLSPRDHFININMGIPINKNKYIQIYVLFQTFLLGYKLQHLSFG